MRDLKHIVVLESQRGKTTDELVRYLLSRGWPESSARAFVRNALTRDRLHMSLADNANRAGTRTKTQPREPDHERKDHEEELREPVPNPEPLIWALVATGLLFTTLLVIGAMPYLH